MIATQGKTSLTSEQVRELIPGLLFCKDCEQWTPHYGECKEEGYCNFGLGSACADDFCSQGIPKRRNTWGDVKRWLDKLTDEELNLTAYVYLTNSKQWDGAHEITGITPWDSSRPVVRQDNELAFDIEE